MHREIHQWWSPRLNKNMEIAVYGNYGPALLMFPTAGADYLEYERFRLIDSISWFINSGKLKVFSINSINNESWLNRDMWPPHKAIRHNQYNYYVIDEVIPFIHSHCKGLVPIVTTGASLGAFHAVNMFLRRPDIFAGTIGLSGIYDLKYYTRGFYNEDVYFNSPIDYLPNLYDEGVLNQMRHYKKILLASGSGDYEDPDSSIQLSNILHSKGIPNEVAVWGWDMPHDWPTWHKMLPHFLGSLY